ncbi:MAG: tripartite tricarboxylate transporter TctB family protein [Geminicoccaceae bacterium]
MVAGLLAVLSGAKALALARGQELGDGRSQFVEEEAPESGPLQPWRAIAALSAFGGYCLTLGTLGFPLATALLLGMFLLVAGYRRPAPLLMTSAGGSVALFLLFRTVVYVSLPLGVGPFQSLSLGLLRLLGAS